MRVVEVVEVLLSFQKLYKFISLIPRHGNRLVQVLLSLQVPSCQTSTQLYEFYLASRQSLSFVHYTVHILP